MSGTHNAPQTTDHIGRDAKDFAIEFGVRLANAADRMMNELRREAQEHDGVNVDVWRGLEDAIHEFRKRATRVAAPEAFGAGEVPGTYSWWLEWLLKQDGKYAR